MHATKAQIKERENLTALFSPINSSRHVKNTFRWNSFIFSSFSSSLPKATKSFSSKLKINEYKLASFSSNKRKYFGNLTTSSNHSLNHLLSFSILLSRRKGLLLWEGWGISAAGGGEETRREAFCLTLFEGGGFIVKASPSFSSSGGSLDLFLLDGCGFLGEFEFEFELFG